MCFTGNFPNIKKEITGIYKSRTLVNAGEKSVLCAGEAELGS